MSNQSVHGIPVGAVLSEVNATWMAQAEANCSYPASLGPHRRRRECVGILYSPPLRSAGDSNAEHWERRLVRGEDPIFFPMHGGVTAQRMMRLALQLMRLGPLELKDAASWPNRTVVVELGSGNAAALSVMAPPLPHVYGVGTDIARSLIAHARAFYPHLLTHAAIGAPMVPTGVAAYVVSIAVMMYLPEAAACNHVAEGLRLLRPGGVMVLHGIPRRNPAIGGWTTFGDAFFVDRRPDGARRFLPMCTNLHDLLADVELVNNGKLAVYPAPTFITARLVRGEAAFPCRVASDDDPDAFFEASDAARRERRAFERAGMVWYRNRSTLVLKEHTPPWLRCC